MYKNAITPIIVMLDYLKIDMEISDTSMETVGSNDYREILGDNRSMLAII